MTKVEGLVILLIVVIVLGVLIAAIREVIPGPLEPDAEVTVIHEVTNSVGQGLVTVRSDGVGSWVKANPDKRIVSITSIGSGSHGRTSAYLIVYEGLRAEKEQ
jgi:hypothetical protein